LPQTSKGKTLPINCPIKITDSSFVFIKDLL
jgi:hypothetical protein